MMATRMRLVRRVELVTAMVSVYIGLVWLHPVDSFTRAQAYRVMAELAPEWAWGAVAVLAGAGLLTKRAIAVLGFVFVWAIAAIAWLVSNPLAAGPAYGVGAVLYASFVYRERRRA